MTYTVTIIASAGAETTFLCGGAGDQDALVYAGKVVQKNADPADPEACVEIKRDGEVIGPRATVAEMMRRAV